MRNAFEALALIACAALAGPAVATTVVTSYAITYQGHVYSGSDRYGLFGEPNADLTNRAFTAVFTLGLPATGSLVNNIYAPGSWRIGEVGGGCALDSRFCGYASPLSARLTIAGVALDINGLAGGWCALLDADPPSVMDDAICLAFQYGGVAKQITLQGDVIAGLGGMIDDPYIGSALASADYVVDHVVDDDNNTYLDVYGHDGGRSFVSMITDRVTIGLAPVAPPAVPEPSTWALMIAGLGLTGRAMRRRGCVARRRAASEARRAA